MSEELRAAAERIRLAGDKRGWHQAYIGNVHIWEQDIEQLARAYLAENDETPLDEAFLQLIGFQIDDEDDYLWIAGPTFDVQCYPGGYWCVAADGVHVRISAPSSRGQLRRLASALGISLKDQS